MIKKPVMMHFVLCCQIKRITSLRRVLCRHCDAVGASWTDAPSVVAGSESEEDPGMQLLLLKHRPRSSGACLQALCRLHPRQGAVKTGRVTRRAVDLPPLERAGAGNSARSTKPSHPPHRGCSKSSASAVGRQHQGARLTEGGQLCAWRRCCP